MPSRLVESAEGGQAHDQPASGKNRRWHGHPEIFVRRFAGQCSKAAAGGLDSMLIIATQVERLCEGAPRHYAKPRVPAAPGDFRGSSADRGGLVQLSQV